MKNMTNNAQFTTMLYNNRHLILKTSEHGNPHVIAECYLLETADQVCQLLTAAADTTEETQKTEVLK
jgi:hypothetical protein